MTWNMARKKIVIKPEQLFANVNHVDMIVCGFQESKMRNQSDVQLRIQQYLRRHDFVQIAHSAMWEIMMVVFVKSEHAANIRDPEIRSYRNGLFGMVGNKGGIQFNCVFKNHLFNFMTCHLRHGQNAAEQRNEMMSHFVKETKSREAFKKQFDLDVLSDFSVILGDMNYRMDTTYTEFIG